MVITLVELCDNESSKIAFIDLMVVLLVLLFICSFFEILPFLMLPLISLCFQVHLDCPYAIVSSQDKSKHFLYDVSNDGI